MAKKQKSSLKSESAKEQIVQQSVYVAPSTSQVNILSRVEVIRKIKEKLNYEDNPNIIESEIERSLNKIKLICTYLEYSSTTDDDLLKMFSLFLVQEENFLYNFGYFTDKISSFKGSILPIQQRLDHILECCKGITTSLSKTDLVKYIFRFDELYDFTFEDNSFDVKIKVQNVHNFSFDCKRKYTIRVLEKGT